MSWRLLTTVIVTTVAATLALLALATFILSRL
jgi:hypothetical protein